MTEWHRVVFSDESRFCLSSDSRRVRVWRRRGERSNPAAIVERPTVRQRGIKGTMTAQRYVDDVLRPVTLPYLQGVPNALYQQDKARPHTARISQQALQDVQMLPWPPYSPDLSPIEHVWDIIGRRLNALPQPRSEDELWQMAQDVSFWSPSPDKNSIRTVVIFKITLRDSRQDYHNEGDHNEEGKDCPDRKEPRSKMEEQTNPSNDTAEQTIPKQETTLEEEETAPPQDTSADPLTQIADALSKLLVARSPREIDVSPYDGTFEAQSFFDNFDAQADRTELTYTDRLRKLPCYLQGISQMTRIITTQYYWKGISKSIEKFVRSCHTCQIIKRPKDTIAGFSKYGHSKTYLHVIVDHLTRYAWTFPSKSTSTLTYIQTLKTVLQQGSPKRLLSDRAPAFTSEKFRKFLIMHGKVLQGSGQNSWKFHKKEKVVPKKKCGKVSEFYTRRIILTRKTTRVIVVLVLKCLQ
ncbi:hypothetical protein LAZ67_3003662 [Cordylochernes scorpioides]|uniref:RNA-directed DNA polymerase n=1 Tax=Cordylochernes scorpioides TaxID=51811 RepID=A0ABY6K8S8_9ARAC|nr:hypothetical protein LAZ67_3003662 [Cordylochernes scorpioides]